MTAIVDSETWPVLITSKTELSARSGGILRALSTGALVRIDDCNLGAEACLMIPPQLIPQVLEFLGLDPAALPVPGEVHDAPDPVPHQEA